MSVHKEISFEDEVCEHLATHGWLYSPVDAAHYDRARALFAPDLVAWVQESQPKAWEALTKTHGAAAEATLLDRVRRQLDDRGTLDLLRHKLEIIGVRQPLSLVQFRPAMGMNPEIVRLYNANRLRVVRQVRYSTANKNCIDLVLFLNGIPVATVELKTDFTQSIVDATDQYKYDRLPKPKGSAGEPLLTFPSGALVHFAVSNREVQMTTRLEGPATTFLPFNKGDEGGAGNPANPNGHRTAYLWEEVWQRESWLEILGRYLVTQRNAKKEISKIIFPRYHQLDATRKLVTQVLEEGAGGKFLIQHSAGSGKTNSIAWSAHFLSELHDEADNKVFSAVIVVSDRKVVDDQLQDALFDFQRTTGVVETIKTAGESKSRQLTKALDSDKKIIVCTIQTFPAAIKAVQERADTQGKRFAVIADEAHSSQTGRAAGKLRELLSADELADIEDGGEIAAEDILNAQMGARAGNGGITYVAFTATPKAKTIELFGRRPDLSRPAGEDNLPAAFHVYSMRQAIEEGFILDVLKNYTPYKLAFRLANGGKEWDEKEVERDTALKGIMRWVRLHPYNISQKVQIVVEHFRENVGPLLDGKAKAMVVLGSRQEAVRWQLAVNAYIRERGYRMGTLVAFSGEVKDKESSDEPLTETSAKLNPGLRGRDIRDAFEEADFQLLLVASKFQTGFDQPLLCGMYVDRRLAGIQAVQTLSRLNRAHAGKDTTYVLDFVNSSEEILKAFSQYYETAELEGVTDPNVIYDVRAKLDASGHYDEFEVDRVAKAELNPASKQSDLFAAIEPVADRLLKKYAAAKKAWTDAKARDDEAATKTAFEEMGALELFKNDLGVFQRLYSFLSQIFDYGNSDIEKRYIFYHRLAPLLKFGREREGVDLSQVTLTHHALRKEAQRNLAVGEAPKLSGMSEAGSGSVNEKEKARLAEIIERVNDLFGADTTDDDKLNYVNGFLKSHMLASEELKLQAMNNTRAQFDNSPTLRREFMDAVMDSDAAFNSMSRKVLASDALREELLRVLLGPGQLYEALRGYPPESPGVGGAA